MVSAVAAAAAAVCSLCVCSLWFSLCLLAHVVLYIMVNICPCFSRWFMLPFWRLCVSPQFCLFPISFSLLCFFFSDFRCPQLVLPDFFFDSPWLQMRCGAEVFVDVIAVVRGPWVGIGYCPWNEVDEN